MLVFVAYAVVDEDAVMVDFRDAMFADATVLRAGRFEEFACVAGLTWMEDGEVVGVQRHGMGVVGLGNVAGVCGS